MVTGTTTRRYGGRTAEERRAERRQRLLDAGLELYGTEGYQAASVERLCETAGLSTRQFYEEYSNRNELLLELYDRIQDEASAVVQESVREALAADVDFRETLRRATQVYAAAVATDPRRALVAYVTMVGISPELEAHREARRDTWTELLCVLAEQCADRGQIPRRDFRLTMRGYVGAVNELVHFWAAAGDSRPPIDEVVETLVHLLHSALSK